ncbi:hypothetical protein DSECCO2_508830 [anaerobic digester metagenome]
MTSINPYTYDNSFPRTAYLAYNKKDERLFIPLQGSKLTGRIAGPLAELVLEQVFSFGIEEC